MNSEAEQWSILIRRSCLAQCSCSTWPLSKTGGAFFRGHSANTWGRPVTYIVKVKNEWS